MNFALCFFPVMPCVKPSIPSNSRIIYPRTDQVRYTHGTTLYLACHEGHLLTGSPIMECNYTTWLKREFKCIGMFFFLLSCDLFHLPHAILCETMIKLTCGLRELVLKMFSGHTLARFCCIFRESGS